MNSKPWIMEQYWNITRKRLFQFHKIWNHCNATPCENEAPLCIPKIIYAPSNDFQWSSAVTLTFSPSLHAAHVMARDLVTLLLPPPCNLPNNGGLRLIPSLLLLCNAQYNAKRASISHSERRFKQITVLTAVPYSSFTTMRPAAEVFVWLKSNETKSLLINRWAKIISSDGNKNLSSPGMGGSPLLDTIW